MVKGKSKHCQQPNQGKQDQISHAERERLKKIIGKCFTSGRPDHLMPECKISGSVKYNSCNTTACSKCQIAHSQPTLPLESTDYTLYSGISSLWSTFLSAANAYTITTISYFIPSFGSPRPSMDQSSCSKQKQLQQTTLRDATLTRPSSGFLWRSIAQLHAWHWC